MSEEDNDSDNSAVIFLPLIGTLTLAYGLVIPELNAEALFHEFGSTLKLFSCHWLAPISLSPPSPPRRSG